MNGWICLVRASSPSAEIKSIPLPIPLRRNGGPIEGWIVELDRRGAELWGRVLDPVTGEIAARHVAQMDKVAASVDVSRATCEDLQRFGDLFARETTGVDVEPRAEIIVANKGEPIPDDQIDAILDALIPRPDVSFTVQAFEPPAARMIRNEPERRTEIVCSSKEAEIVRRHYADVFGADRVKVEPGRVLVLDAPHAKDNGVYGVDEDGKLSRSTNDEPLTVYSVDLAKKGDMDLSAIVKMERAQDGTMRLVDYMVIPSADVESCPWNPRRIDRILPAAEMMGRAIAAGSIQLSAFQNEQLQVDERIAGLIVRLDRLAKTIPRLAPTVEALLQRAANSDDTFGDLAVGLRRIQAGDEIVNGEWVRGSLSVTSPGEVRKIFEALSTAARDGAEAWKQAAAELSRIGFAMGDRYIERGPAGATENGVYVVTDVGSTDDPVRLSREEPSPARPNRHERRKQAAIARRAKR